jgi:imidazole glycerol-phosphate synthase subunit HisH
MGWNQLTAIKESRLLAGIGTSAYFYFAHSYAALDSNDQAHATCTYRAEFAAVIEHQNIFAVQFHPEKSGEAGARVLQNFLRLAA